MPDVERCPAPSPDEFRRRHARPSRPVVLTGAMDTWPARRWTFADLAERHGSRSVPIKVAFYVQREVTLASYLDLVQGRGPDAGSLAYLSNLDLSHAIPELRGDFAFPPYHWLDRLAYFNFWIGPRGTLSNLHCDFAHNLLAQVLGTKRILLHAPGKTPLLGPEKTTFYSSFSGYDCATSAADRPAVPGDVEPDHELELAPGEMLFIPFGWWHRVRSLAPSISINRWWWTPRMTVTQGAGMVALLARQRFLARGRCRPSTTIPAAGSPVSPTPAAYLRRRSSASPSPSSPRAAALCLPASRTARDPRRSPRSRAGSASRRSSSSPRPSPASRAPPRSPTTRRPPIRRCCAR